MASGPRHPGAGGVHGIGFSLPQNPQGSPVRPSQSHVGVEGVMDIDLAGPNECLPARHGGRPADAVFQSDVPPSIDNEAARPHALFTIRARAQCQFKKRHPAPACGSVVHRHVGWQHEDVRQKMHKMWCRRLSLTSRLLFYALCLALHAPSSHLTSPPSFTQDTI